MSTPTSRTLVATRILVSPAVKEAMTARFSSSGTREWITPMRNSG